MKRIQITLTDEETQVLTDVATQYGYRLHRLLKLILSKEVSKYLSQEHKMEYISEIKEQLAYDKTRQHIRNFRKEHGLQKHSDDLLD